MEKYSELVFDPEKDITYYDKLKKQLNELRQIEEILDNDILILKTKLALIENKFNNENSGNYYIIQKKGFKKRKIGVVIKAERII